MTDDPQKIPPWLEWARQIAAVAQTGLFFKNSPYDLERYEKLQKLAAEIFSFYSKRSPEELIGELSDLTGYATPKVDVRAAVFDQFEILLVRERADGLWCLPGGWADVGDEPSAAAVRELFEESGVRAKATKLIGVFDGNRGAPPTAYHGYKLIFHCTGAQGSFKPNTEILEAAYFSEQGLPELSSARTSRVQIEECFRHLENPERPTYFD